MNKHLFKALTLSAMFALSATALQSCGDDDDENDDTTPVIEPEHIAYILNEGSFQGNNATLDIYHPDSNPIATEQKAFSAANGQAIGDTGQDLVAYGKRLYLSVFGSNYLAKLDDKCKLIEKYEFNPEEGQPRFIAVDGGFVYVTTYGGKVAKFDTTSIAAPVAFVEVGNNPEHLAVSGNYLVVANSQKDNVGGNRISVVDLASFSLKENITTDYSNFQNVTSVGDSVYLTYYTPSWSIEMLNLDISTGKVKPAGAATKFEAFDNKLYCVNVGTVYDENWNATTNTTFFVRDVKTGKDSDFLDLSATPELASATVYLFDIDFGTGYYYVGITDYVTPGTIYRFDNDGKFIEKFETSGINPSKMEIVNW